MSGSKLGGLLSNALRVAVLVVVAAGAAWVANRADIVEIPLMDRLELPFLTGGEDDVAVEPQQGTAAIELVAVSYLENGRTMISVSSEEPIPEGEFVGLVRNGSEQLEFSCEQLPEYPDRVYCSGLGAGPETPVEFQLGFKSSQPTLAQRLLQTGQLPAMQFAMSSSSGRQAVAAGSSPIDLASPSAGFDEPIIEFDEPIIEFDEPIIEVDDGQTQFDEPIIEFDEPIIEFDEPIIEYDDPVIAFESPASVLDPANFFMAELQQVSLGQRTVEMAFDPSQGIWGTTGTLQPLEETINQRFDAIEGCLADYDPSLAEATVQSTDDAYNALLYMAAVDQSNGQEPLADCAVAGEIQAVQHGAIAETACYLSGSLECTEFGTQSFPSNREIFQAIRSDEAVCWYALGLDGEFEDPSQLEELAAAVEEADQAGEDLPEVCRGFLQGDGFAVGVETYSMFVAQTELPPDWYEDFHDRFGGFGDLTRPGSSDGSDESGPFNCETNKALIDWETGEMKCVQSLAYLLDAENLAAAQTCSLDLRRSEPITPIDLYELGVRVNRMNIAGEQLSTACQAVKENHEDRAEGRENALDESACAQRRLACENGIVIFLPNGTRSRMFPSEEACGVCDDLGEGLDSRFSIIAKACAADFGWYGGEIDNPAEEMSLLRHVTGLAGLIPSKYMPESCRTFMEFYASLGRADGFNGLIEASLKGGLERISPAEGLWSESISFITPPSAGSSEDEGPQQIEATDIPEAISCPPGQILNVGSGECEIIN